MQRIIRRINAFLSFHWQNKDNQWEIQEMRPRKTFAVCRFVKKKWKKQWKAKFCVVFVGTNPPTVHNVRFRGAIFFCFLLPFFENESENGATRMHGSWRHNNLKNVTTVGSNNWLSSKLFSNLFLEVLLPMTSIELLSEIQF